MAVDAWGRWLALLLFSAAAWHHKHPDRRLGLVVNHSRFLILPHARVPNLGSRVLWLAQPGRLPALRA